MIYSLINVEKEADGMVNGYWVQDVTGTFAEATKRARDTEAVNSNKITIAVTERVNSPVPRLDYHTNVTRVYA